jgi:hypothetical protein
VRKSRRADRRSAWDAEWAERRLRLVPRRCAATSESAGEPQSAWNVARGVRPDEHDDDDTELRIAREEHSAVS